MKVPHWMCFPLSTFNFHLSSFISHLSTIMLSKQLHHAINAQINAELWSAYLYLSMSMDAEAKGLKGVAYLQRLERVA